MPQAHSPALLGSAPRFQPARPRLRFAAAARFALALALTGFAAPARALDCSDPSFISNADARQIVLTQFIQGSPDESRLMAFAYPVPLPLGTVIDPAEPEDGGPSMSTRGCAWLFYLDLDPESGFAHATRFVLVGGSSSQPEVSSTDQLWWPVVAGTPLYDVPEVTKTSPDLFFGAMPSADCGSAPAGAAAPGGTPQDVAAATQWAIGFIGPDTWLNNWTAFKAALGTYAGVPAANADRWVFHDDNMKAAVKEANDNNASRVWVYIACHGLEGSHKLQTKDDPDLAPADVAKILADLNACSVYVVINACFSGNFRQPIIDALKARARRLNSFSPSTVAVFTSAEDSKASVSDGENEIGYFTKALIGGWGQTGVTTLEQAFDWVVSGQNACAKSKVGNPQKLVDSQGCDPTPAMHSTWGTVKVRYR